MRFHVSRFESSPSERDALQLSASLDFHLDVKQLCPSGYFDIGRRVSIVVDPRRVSLCRDNLTASRLDNAKALLESGKEAKDPIQVVRDPENPYRYIVYADGNHRVAAANILGLMELKVVLLGEGR